MTTLMFRQFTHLNVLKACGVALLERLFDRFRESIATAKLAFPVPGTGEKAEKEYYKALLQIFREPERLPGDLCEVLYQIDALANAESADRLTFVADAKNIPLQNTEDPTEAEVALQIWLLKPDVFATEYSAQKLLALRTFTKFVSEKPGPVAFSKPTAVQCEQMAGKMRPWFKRYGRGEDIWITPSELNGEWWFVIGHGERMSRTGAIEKGAREIRVYRPDKDDVLVYTPETNAVRVCAGTMGLKRQFRNAFGAIFFESEKCFENEEVYRFEPLMEDAEAVLDCRDLDGIDEISFVELRYYAGGKFKEIVTRRATDIVALYEDRGWNLPEGKYVHRACFEVLFTGHEKARPVKITSRGTIQIVRDCDNGPVHGWLKKREMEIGSGEDGNAGKA